MRHALFFDHGWRQNGPTRSKLVEPEMKPDSQGLAVTTDSDQAIAAINHFTEAAVVLKPGMADITAAARREPECAMLQICAAVLHTLSQSNREARRGVRYLDLARQRSADLNERERAFIDAVAAGCDGDFDRAIAAYGQIIERWPRDILAAKLAEFHCFETGDARRQLEIMENLASANGDSPHALAMYGFALELNGRRDRAEQVSRAALRLDPDSMWAQHCLAHLYGEQGRASEGIAALENYAPGWRSFGQYIQAHNWFHLATLYLMQLDFDRALDAYRHHIWGFQSDEIVEHTDAILLLWYVELSGGEVQERWREVAPHIRAKAHEQVFPFLTSIYLYALERAGESAEVDRALAEMEEYARRQTGRAAYVWSEIGINQARGSVAFARGDFDRAATLLGSALGGIASGGGSDEQRAVFAQSHFLSLSRAGHTQQAQQALHDYLAGRSSTALFQRWRAELGG
jgi:tetratricopeptide (TPR) repeat protein